MKYTEAYSDSILSLSGMAERKTRFAFAVIRRLVIPIRVSLYLGYPLIVFTPSLQNLFAVKYLFLIRHGESVSNSGDNYIKRIPDHLVSLTENGKMQASENGKWLAEYCIEKGIDLSKARIWRSPFLRTRQTCDEFNKYLRIREIREDITLTEQQFGLFDALPQEEWEKQYPREYAEYIRQIANQGKFYARLPLGESPFDVAIRIHQFMGTIYRDYEKHGIDTLFIFTHGTTLRTFLMRWFHYSPEWYHDERNPKNCWIREIIDNTDLGYINNK